MSSRVYIENFVIEFDTFLTCMCVCGAVCLILASAHTCINHQTRKKPFKCTDTFNFIYQRIIVE